MPAPTEQPINYAHNERGDCVFSQMEENGGCITLFGESGELKERCFSKFLWMSSETKLKPDNSYLMRALVQENYKKKQSLNMQKELPLKAKAK